MLRLKDLPLVCSMEELNKIPDGKILINTINAFSYNNAQGDDEFAHALKNCDYLIPDGISIVYACRFLNSLYRPKERIAGWDLFKYEMERLNSKGGKVMFVGSSNEVLERIKKRITNEMPQIETITLSPPYKETFSEEDNDALINAINDAKPDLLWIGLTAPKQEKWITRHWERLDINCHCGTIGAVFDFYAGTKKRAPVFWQRHGIEWLHRLITEPRRLWRRYLLGNIMFVIYILAEKIRRKG